jgi:hypothetical protein
VLPEIAKIFEVSSDSLLGYGRVLSNKEWIDMYNKITSFIQMGKKFKCGMFIFVDKSLLIKNFLLQQSKFRKSYSLLI